MPGGFCGPYVVGALVDRGGYVQCMQVLGGLFLVMGVAIACASSFLTTCLVALIVPQTNTGSALLLAFNSSPISEATDL